MSSSSDPAHPKPFSVTGYPASVDPAATSAVTAYPYPNPYPPPYNPNPNPNYYQNPNPNPNYYPPNRQPSPFIRRFIGFVVGVIIAVAAVTFIVWLVLRPQVPQFSVSSLAVSSFNLTSSNLLSSNFALTLSISNPNHKLTAYYDSLTTGVVYDDFVIAETSLAPFEQTTRNVTEVGVTMVAVGEYVGDDVASGIGKEKGSRLVRFGVRVFGVVRFRKGGWRLRRHVLRVWCDGVGVGLNGTSGAMVGGKQPCHVGL